VLRALRVDVMDRVGVAANLNYRLDNPAVGRVRLAYANPAVGPPVATLDRVDPAIASHRAGANLGLFPQRLVGVLGIVLCLLWHEEVGHQLRFEPRRVAPASGGG